MPYGYNTTVPQIVRDIYSSGTAHEKTTVSNYFDIEWRQWGVVQSNYKDNGSSSLVADYRPINSLILNDAIIPVEGLVVDMINGGVGFRNHTLPKGQKHGATWTEDLLFIEPQSSCVNLNITLDFTVPSNASEGTLNTLSEQNLVDRGGFYALNTTYPEYDHADAQNNPDLYGRAYKAAYLNNVFTMAYLNVTNTNDSTYGAKSFSYLNSYNGKSFPIATPYSSYDGLFVSNTYGDYLDLGGDSLQNTSSNLSNSTSYPNPFNITLNDFSDVCKFIV